jgi:hypothetical protein
MFRIVSLANGKPLIAIHAYIKAIPGFLSMAYSAAWFIEFIWYTSGEDNENCYIG